MAGFFRVFQGLVMVLHGYRSELYPVSLELSLLRLVQTLWKNHSSFYFSAAALSDSKILVRQTVPNTRLGKTRARHGVLFASCRSALSPSGGFYGNLELVNRLEVFLSAECGTWPLVSISGSRLVASSLLRFH